MTIRKGTGKVLIVLALLGFALIIGLEVPGLVKKKMWWELTAFSVYLAIGMALSIPQLLGIRPFEPNAPIEALFRPLGELLRGP